MKENLDKNRIKWLDMARGYAIILVIVGHLNIRWFPHLEPMINVIYSFHMHLFFVLSGYTFNFYKYKNLKELLVNKFKTLLIPYYMFAILALIKPIGKYILTMFNKDKVEISILGDIFNVLVFGEGLWFLTCLFLAEIIFYYIIKVCSNNYRKISSIIFITSIIGYTYCKFINLRLPFKAELLFISITFLGIGYILREKENIINRYINIKSMLFFIILNIISNIFNYKYYGFTINIGLVSNYLMYYITSVSGILFSIIFIRLLPSNSTINFIGRNSLIYYIMNDLILKILKFIAFIVLGINNNTIIVSLINGGIFVIVACIIIYPIVIFINKYCPFMIGKLSNNRMLR